MWGVVIAAVFGFKHIGGDREGDGGRDRGTPTREGADGKAPIPIPPYVQVPKHADGAAPCGRNLVRVARRG